MRKKIFLMFFVVVFSMLSFVGCGKKEDGKIKVGVAIGTFNDTFMVGIKDYIADYAKSAYGDDVELTITDAKNDPAVQVSQVENFVTQGMDAVIILPVSTESTDPMTLACKEAGIPVVYVNRKPNQLGDYALYIGSDEKEAGKLQGEFIAKELNGKGNIVILMGKLDTEAAFLRTEGVEEIVAKYPDLKITKKQTGGWERPLGMQVTENWLSTGDKIDAIISNNDDMALGAIKALEGAGKMEGMKVLGVDATPDAIAELEAGNLTASVFQNGKGQAEGAVDKVINAVKGEQVDQITWIPFQLVTKDTYKDIVVR
jgi:inositol transport system substrate-binding protein